MYIFEQGHIKITFIVMSQVNFEYGENIILYIYIIYYIIIIFYKIMYVVK